jgi:hypothetical protein
MQTMFVLEDGDFEVHMVVTIKNIAFTVLTLCRWRKEYVHPEHCFFLISQLSSL